MMFGFEIGHVQNRIVLVLEMHIVTSMKTDVPSMLALGQTNTRDFFCQTCTY